MLTLNDGRSELWKFDTGRKVSVDADCSQVHFSNKVFGRSIDVDVIDGVAIVPDILLSTDKDLNVWAFVGTAENGYTKISKTFKVNRRNKPADYVFTPVEQMTIQEIKAIAKSVRDDADAGAFNGKDGKDGADGTPASHRWSGTTLYITSASGTSSADLKGEQGDVGPQGIKGEKGEPGDAYQAPPIVLFNNGKIINLNDSSKRPLRVLKLYGKTIQNGTPSPENPVALESVGDGGTITVKVGETETDENPQVLTISTPNGLPGIPVSSGGNYTDESGQQWICDEIDFARGVYVQRVFEKVFDGTEGWKVSPYQTDGAGTRYDCNVPYPSPLLFKCISEHYPHNGVSKKGIWVNADDTTRLGLRIQWTYETEQELKAFLAEQYAAGTPVRCKYPIRTPIETPIPAEELAQYAVLHTNEPNTTVFNDYGTDMEVRYVADTKMYIDNKLTEFFNAN